VKAPVRAFIDGGSRGNPGPAGFGVHVQDGDGVIIAELYGFLGRATNNVAEYAALIKALEWAREHSCRSLRLFSDSELLVRQFRGEYKVRNAGLLPLYARAKVLARGIPSLEVAHVPRERNTEADALANRAMDEEGGNVVSPLPASAP
jgi:probable phosphoglycerate mutase